MSDREPEKAETDLGTVVIGNLDRSFSRKPRHELEISPPAGRILARRDRRRSTRQPAS